MERARIAIVRELADALRIEFVPASIPSGWLPHDPSQHRAGAAPRARVDPEAAYESSARHFRCCARCPRTCHLFGATDTPLLPFDVNIRRHSGGDAGTFLAIERRCRGVRRSPLGLRAGHHGDGAAEASCCHGDHPQWFSIIKTRTEYFIGFIELSLQAPCQICQDVARGGPAPRSWHSTQQQTIKHSTVWML